jgi:hypothetical protein
MKPKQKKQRLKPGDPYRCECGREHKLSLYVAAHWNEEIVHTCECGRKHIICRGIVYLVGDKA